MHINQSTSSKNRGITCKTLGRSLYDDVILMLTTHENKKNERKGDLFMF